MGRSRRRLITLRPRADQDIDEQFEYLAIEADLAVARRFLAATRETLGKLLRNPEIGSVRTFADERLSELRVWPISGFRRYLVFYLPQPNGIEIVRILHGSRDVDALFE